MNERRRGLFFCCLLSTNILISMISPSSQAAERPSDSKDALELDSGLWKAEYAKTFQQNEDSAASDSTGTPSFGNETIPVLISTRQLEPGGLFAESLVTDEQKQISDWENANMNPASQQNPSNIPSGPSLTTCLLVFAAGVVLTGTIFSPR